MRATIRVSSTASNGSKRVCVDKDDAVISDYEGSSNRAGKYAGDQFAHLDESELIRDRAARGSSDDERSTARGERDMLAQLHISSRLSSTRSVSVPFICFVEFAAIAASRARWQAAIQAIDAELTADAAGRRIDAHQAGLDLTCTEATTSCNRTGF